MFDKKQRMDFETSRLTCMRSSHSVVDRSINVLLGTGCLVAKAIERTLCFMDRHVICFWPIAIEKN